MGVYLRGGRIRKLSFPLVERMGFKGEITLLCLLPISEWKNA